MNTRSGCAALTRPISAGQYSSAGAGPARSPQVRANTSLVISIAMSQRTPSHCAPIADQRLGHRVAQLGRERVELDDVGPRREVGVARRARRSRRRRAGTPPGRAARSSSVPRDEAARPLGHPRMVGRDVVGHVVEDQPERRASASCARAAASPPGPPKRCVDDVVAHAVGRADHVLRRAGPAARRGCPRRAPGRSSAIASPAGLRSHTPISQTASTGSAASASQSAPGTSPSVQPSRCEPDRGVDLVDRRAGRQSHQPARRRCTSAARARSRPAGTAARPSRSSRSGGSRRCRRRCRRGSTRGTAAGRASADRSGTARSRRTPAGARRSSAQERARSAARRSRARPRAGSSSRPEPVGHSTLKSSP